MSSEDNSNCSVDSEEVRTTVRGKLVGYILLSVLRRRHEDNDKKYSV